MKLFLSSDSVLAGTKQAFMGLVGLPKGEIKIAVIENAADNYSPDNRTWVKESRHNLEACADEVQQIDLRNFSDSSQLKKSLEEYNVIWIGGGNVYYLRWLAKRSGLDQIIHDLIQKGIVYGGESAGAVIAGPTLDGFQEADDPQEADEIMLEGFRLIETVVVPHCDHPKYADLMRGAARHAEQLGFNSVQINENQAAIVDGSNMKIVG